VLAELANEHAVGERLERDATQLREERIRLTERVTIGGCQEDYDAAATRQASAQRQDESQCRQAEAAELAWSTLTRHRAEARSKYVAPFREQLERFGQIVFGSGLHLEIGEDLQVIRRTLDRVTVPYESLSGGTKEQLCVCARLACAALVNPEEGAPVIIDDALGYTDPQRLRQMGAVFAEASKNCQVIVFTCVPERYRGIGPPRYGVFDEDHSPSAARGRQASHRAEDAGDRQLRLGGAGREHGGCARRCRYLLGEGPLRA
jgi:hypothetical protein